MPVIRTRTVVSADGVHEVSHQDRRMRVAIKPVDPIVHVAGVAVEWEVTIIDVDGDGREFHGYGADRAMAFANAREAAIAGGADFGGLWDVVAAGMLNDWSRR